MEKSKMKDLNKWVQDLEKEIELVQDFMSTLEEYEKKLKKCVAPLKNVIIAKEEVSKLCEERLGIVKKHKNEDENANAIAPKLPKLPSIFLEGRVKVLEMEQQKIAGPLKTVQSFLLQEFGAKFTDFAANADSINGGLELESLLESDAELESADEKGTDEELESAEEKGTDEEEADNPPPHDDDLIFSSIF